MTQPGNSRIIDRAGPDERLESVVGRHVQTSFEKPVQPHNRRAFDVLQKHLEQNHHGEALVLDAGCGTGVSCLRLARRHPDAVIVGIDKSIGRLGRGVRMNADDIFYARERVAWIRSDLIDFWRLAAAAGLRFARQYLLYPNPWPKRAHLQRRWHGHPVFPSIVKASPILTLRTNWETYAIEFVQALSMLGIECETRAVVGEELTPFEAKYRASGHTLLEVFAVNHRVPAEGASEVSAESDRDSRF
ncbi:MAG: SAM-dependent methyltransferase [Myxococcota bacterium]